MSRMGILACTLATFFSFAAAATARPQAPVDTPAAHREAGWKAYGASDYKAAKREFSRAAKLDKTDAESFVGLALVARLEGKHDEALEHVDRALQLRPDSSEGHELRGWLYYDDDDIPNARAQAEWALRISTSRSGAYVLMGDVLVAELRFKEAVASFDEARRLAKEVFDATTRQRDRYEDVKAYVDWKAIGTEDAPDYVKPHILNRPRPEYTEKARAARTSGSVQLLIHLTAGGRVDRVVVVTELPNGLTDNAVRSARELRAKPAILAGQPVEAWSVISVNFWIR